MNVDGSDVLLARAAAATTASAAFEGRNWGIEWSPAGDRTCSPAGTPRRWACRSSTWTAGIAAGSSPTATAANTARRGRRTGGGSPSSDATQPGCATRSWPEPTGPATASSRPTRPFAPQWHRTARPCHRRRGGSAGRRDRCHHPDGVRPRRSFGRWSSRPRRTTRRRRRGGLAPHDALRPRTAKVAGAGPAPATNPSRCQAHARPRLRHARGRQARRRLREVVRGSLTRSAGWWSLCRGLVPPTPATANARLSEPGYILQGVAPMIGPTRGESLCDTAVFARRRSAIPARCPWLLRPLRVRSMARGRCRSLIATRFVAPCGRRWT